MSDEPVIYEKNYVNDGCTFASSYGGTPANVCDRDIDSTWLSSGANDDDTTVTFDITFKENGAAIDRLIDRIVILGCNLKNFLVQYQLDSGGWTTIATVTGQTAEDYVLSFTAVTADMFRISMTATQTVDQEKEIAEVIVTHSLIAPGVGMQNYDVHPRQKAKMLTLGDGSITQVVQLWSTNRSQKYEASVQFSQLSSATYALFLALKESGRSFLWYPEPETAPQEIYWVLWTLPLSKKYTALYKTVGLDIKMELKEL